MNRLIIASILFFTTNLCIADTLLIDIIDKEPANNATGLLRPTHGQTMQQVEASFGTPEKKSAAVGQPPITHWRYKKFTVYFEYNRVIHSVVNKTKKVKK